MLQVLHSLHRSVCSPCRIGDTDQPAPSAALPTQITMLQVLHWPHTGACSNCCTGHPDQHAPNVALATRINMRCDAMKSRSAPQNKHKPAQKRGGERRGEQKRRGRGEAIRAGGKRHTSRSSGKCPNPAPRHPYGRGGLSKARRSEDG